MRKERKGNINLSTIDYSKKLKIELGKLKNTGGGLEQVFRHSSFSLFNVLKVYAKAHTFGRNAYSVVDVTDTVGQLKGGRNLHRFW